MTLSPATHAVLRKPDGPELLYLSLLLIDSGVKADDAYDAAIERGWIEALPGERLRITPEGRAVAKEHLA